MIHGRQRAFLLMVLAVFWSAMPSVACLLNGHSMDQLACCRAMASDCPMQGMEMTGTCCTLQPQQSAVVTDSPVLPGSDCKFALLPHAADAVVPALNAAIGSGASEASPPETSPGAKSILRI